MYFRKAIDIHDSNEKEQLYLSIIEINNSLNAMINLGVHYENVIKDKNKAIEMYLKVINDYDEKDAMFNLGDLYECINDYDNAFKYYDMAIDKEDEEAYDKVLLLCNKLNDLDRFKKYFLKIMTTKEVDDVDDYIHDFKKFILMDFLESINITENNFDTTQIDIFKQNIKNFKKEARFNILETKIRLFTKLNHMSDCGVCLEENVLHIDLECGHCFCVDCYKKIDKDPCPYCRY